MTIAKTNRVKLADQEAPPANGPGPVLAVAPAAAAPAAPAVASVPPTEVYIENNPPNNTPVIVPAFGRIHPGQDVEAGPYVDDVPVRILF